MLYQILWDGEYYTLDAEDLDVAVGAIMVLGYGEFGLRQFSDGETVFPILGDMEAHDEWFLEHYEMDLLEFMSNLYSEDVLECLESVCHGDAIAYRAGFADQEAEDRRHRIAQWYLDHPEKDKRLYAWAQLIVTSEFLLSLTRDDKPWGPGEKTEGS